MKKTLVNIICCFVPSKHARHRLRVEMTHPIRKWVKFAASFSKNKHPVIKRTYGHRYANFVINVDNKFVFKFPLHGNARDIAMREKRITDALRPISPIKIPKMEIVDLDGMSVRKYEYVNGVGFNSLPRAVQNAHIDTFAKTVAKFLFVIGKSNPSEIADLKLRKNERPSVMHGWTQNDLWDNFMVDTKTFDVVGIIDWEGAAFTDFYDCFTSGTGNDKMKNALLREYLKLYNK